KLLLHGMPTERRDTVAFAHGDLNRLPGGQRKPASWDDADLRECAVSDRTRRGAFLAGNPCQLLELIARQSPSWKIWRSNDDDLVLEQRFGLQLRRRDEAARDSKLGAVSAYRVDNAQRGRKL